MTLERLALSRSTLDRAAHRRSEPDLLPTLLADPSARVLVLAGDQAEVSDGDGDGDGGGPQLVLRPATALWDTLMPDTLIAYLGSGADGVDYLAAALPDPPAEASVDSGGALRWAGLRELGSVLDDTGTGLLTAAVALAHWHRTHPRCSRCGEPTTAIQAGWARSCPVCAAEHYPRTDPAVIMSVVDDDGRILLGRQAVWPEKRFSTLAGFVEPGESLEAAVRREVFEESAVQVGEVGYQGSQPWPFPSSLMLAFRARALTTQTRVDGVELAQARWWSREELALDVATEELLLPPPLSIARRLIEEWFGAPIRDGGGAWR